MVRPLVNLRFWAFLVSVVALTAWEQLAERVRTAAGCEDDDGRRRHAADGWVKALTWRSIGPANMAGRITAISVYEADPTTYWVATASGGLLKTTNNGITFEHQFDKEATVSIGDVCVAPSNPQHRLGRHRREQSAQLASPTATASTSRPTAARPGRTWG